MFNKIGYKLLNFLVHCYTMSLVAYLLFIVNVFSHKSCVPILLFFIINTAINYTVLMSAPKIKDVLGTCVLSDICVISVLYSIMHFFTVVLARNILQTWQYTLCQVLFLILYMLSLVSKIMITINKQ